MKPKTKRKLFVVREMKWERAATLAPIPYERRAGRAPQPAPPKGSGWRLVAAVPTGIQGGPRVKRQWLAAFYWERFTIKRAAPKRKGRVKR